MPAPTPLSSYYLTDHARDEMARRQITEAQVAGVLLAPEQSQTIRSGRVVYQSKQNAGDPSKLYLLRVFVDVDREPPEVVTVYRTSKIEKYWEVEP